MITKMSFQGSVNINIAKQHSHSSLYFKGADIVHEGRLLPAHSGHEVPRVGSYGPWFPSEVRLLVDYHLETKGAIYNQGTLWFISLLQDKQFHSLKYYFDLAAI